METEGKIAFDLDNVLADTIGSFCEKATRILRKTVTLDDIKSHKILGSIRLSPREIFRLQDEVWRDWKSIRPTEDRIPQTLGALRGLGLEVFVATSRPQRHMDCVGLWLLFNRVPYDRFFPLGPRVPKATLSCNALVDDATEQLEMFLEEDRIGFLYDRPWNQKPVSRDMVRIKSLGEVLRYYKAKVTRG